MVSDALGTSMKKFEDSPHTRRESARRRIYRPPGTESHTMAAYPKMVRVRQEFKTNPIRDIPGRVRAELAALRLHERIAPGADVAVTAGSRGIANIATILTEVVRQLKAL